MAEIFYILVSSKRSRLNEFQLKKLSEWFFTLGHLIIASLVLKIFESDVKTLDRDKMVVLFLGLTFTVFLFVLGFGLVPKEKHAN